MKINVKGSAFDKPGPSSIAEVLRDDTGTIHRFFSKFIGIADSNAAKFLVIREALLFFFGSDFRNTHYPIIESGSSKTKYLKLTKLG
ncbi:hypothetical protein DITRI_Ditri08aG0143400 [Diplodiscus trichospermus]